MQEKNSLMRYIDFSIIILTLLALTQFSNISFDHSFSRLYPIGQSDFTFYEKYQEVFQIHEEENILLICITPHAGIFNKDFLLKLDSFTNRIALNNDVFKIYALTRISHLYLDQNKLVLRPLIDISSEEKWMKDSSFIFNSEEYSKALFSIDKKSVLVSVFPNLYTSQANYISLLKNIEVEANSMFPQAHHILSKTKLSHAYQWEVKKNVQRTSILALIIISMALIFLNRSIKTLWSSYLPIFITIAWTFGIIGLSNGFIDYLTSLLPLILGIITLTNVIHFRNYFQNTTNKSRHLLKSFKFIGWSVLFANLTTALGFLALVMSDIPSLIQFGLYAAIGIVFGYFLSYYIISREAIGDHTSETSTFISDRKLAYFLKYIIEKRIFIIIAFALASLISLFYGRKIEVNGSLLNELPLSNPIVKDFNYFDTALGGSRIMELSVKNKHNKNGFYHLEELHLLDTLIRYLEDSLQVHSTLSPLTMIRAAHKAYMGGNPNDFRLPDSDQQLGNYISSIYQTPYVDEWKRYFSEDGSTVRISGRVKDMNLKESNDFEKKIQAYIKNRAYNKKIECMLTGESFLMDKIPQYLIHNLTYGLLFSILIMGLIGYHMMGRLKYIPLALIPNIMPLVIVAGFMGYFQIYLKTDTAILFSIAFGMSVDNTIHLLNRFRLEKQEQDWNDSILKTYLQTFRPISLTSILLCAGFISLIFSEFNASKNIGILLTIALLFSWLANVILLPALLAVYDRSKTIYNNEYHQLT